MMAAGRHAVLFLAKEEEIIEAVEMGGKDCAAVAKEFFS